MAKGIQAKANVITIAQITHTGLRTPKKAM